MVRYLMSVPLKQPGVAAVKQTAARAGPFAQALGRGVGRLIGLDGAIGEPAGAGILEAPGPEAPGRLLRAVGRGALCKRGAHEPFRRRSFSRPLTTLSALPWGAHGALARPGAHRKEAANGSAVL